MKKIVLLAGFHMIC